MTKYRAKPTIVDGIRFASKKEAKRYGELKLLEKAGLIRSLETQPKFSLFVMGNKICDYRGDFQYFSYDKSDWILEDVKGFKTPVYRIKKKLIKALYGIEVQEI